MAQLAKFNSYKHDEYEIGHTVSCERSGGIVVSVRVVDDEYADLSYLGEFSHKAEAYHPICIE